MSAGTLVEQAYWDAGYAGMRPAMAPQGDALRAWLEQHVPTAQGEQHAFEIGCFPGRYLSVLGTLGYVVNGIDLTPEITRLGPAFETMGLKVGRFQEGDFLRTQLLDRYDLVCSFGFIEHFTDWRTVLARHADLVKPGGMLVLETPNFRGWFQYLLHRWFDRTNLKRHNTAAMAPPEWANQLRTQGFTVELQGFMGRFDFWRDSPPPNALQRLLLRVLDKCAPLLRRLPEGSAALSPYCVLIARKPANPANAPSLR